jgi:hypothetical protein
MNDKSPSQSRSEPLFLEVNDQYELCRFPGPEGKWSLRLKLPNDDRAHRRYLDLFEVQMIEAALNAVSSYEAGAITKEAKRLLRPAIESHDPLTRANACNDALRLIKDFEAEAVAKVTARSETQAHKPTFHERMRTLQPEGYKLVPLKPTENMCIVGAKHFNAADTYRAMVAAAPEAPK